MDYFPKFTEFGPTKAKVFCCRAVNVDQIQQKYNKFLLQNIAFWGLIQTRGQYYIWPGFRPQVYHANK